MGEKNHYRSKSVHSHGAGNSDDLANSDGFRRFSSSGFAAHPCIVGTRNFRHKKIKRLVLFESFKTAHSTKLLVCKAKDRLGILRHLWRK